jgi:hypothetical protein
MVAAVGRISQDAPGISFLISSPTAAPYMYQALPRSAEAMRKLSAFGAYASPTEWEVNRKAIAKRTNNIE